MGTSVAAIVLSRQALTPCGSTPWVRQALAALNWAKSEGFAVVTSVGMPTWELLCAAASLQHQPQIVLIPAHDRESFDRLESRIRQDFSLDSTASCRPVIGAGDKEAVMQRRDEAALALADIIIPISLRPDGSMARRLQSLQPEKVISDRFALPYELRKEPLKYTIDPSALNPGLDELPQRYLIHWTRAARTCWPDERPIDYYRDLLASDRPIHAAFDTLHHILSTRRLVASNRHMPHDTRTVAFSGLPPREVIPLMRWRARYHEMSFEPYGIGIEWETARSRGLCPVKYFDDTSAERYSVEERWRLQSIGTRTDWSREEEYRHLGDLAFGDIPDDRLMVFCHTPAEAGQLVTATGLPCMSLTAHAPMR